MNNVCELEEIELLEGQPPTLADMWTELNRLKLENERLKVDKLELQEENIQLRNDLNELHNNKNVEENNDPSLLSEYEIEYLNGCDSEEDLKAMQQAYAEFV